MPQVEQLTKPCFECGVEQPVTEQQYNRNLWFPLCHPCRVKAARQQNALNECAAQRMMEVAN